MNTKICTKCGEEKPFVEFTICRSRKSGLSCHCKQCKALYRALHKERTQKYNQTYRTQPRNRNRKNENARKCYHTNLLKTQKEKALYRKSHRIEIIQYMRKWRDKNRQKVKSYNKQYAKEYAKENRNYLNLLSKRRNKKASMNLIDSYVKSKLCRG